MKLHTRLMRRLLLQQFTNSCFLVWLTSLLVGFVTSDRTFSTLDDGVAQLLQQHHPPSTQIIHAALRIRVGSLTAPHTNPILDGCSTNLLGVACEGGFHDSLRFEA